MIFKQGSKTYFYSSLFFPTTMKEEVFNLYSFVRVADDLIDCVPQKVNEFQSFKARYRRAEAGEITGDVVIDGFMELAAKKKFNPKWVNAFLTSMEMDININSYQTMEELDTYLYGSAEVIGLMMFQIMGLPKKATQSARLLGRAMQYVNFIRDISEDNELGRTYFPSNELKEYGLKSLKYEYVKNRPGRFSHFINNQLDKYLAWQHEAENGFNYIPRRYLIPIKTASEMYKWTATVIRRNPLIVYKLKVKPSIKRLISQLSYNMIFTYRR
ncbi:phytoene/squalene synthase family protein [Candidatus Bathyarchaeota archaeon]|nr:phytoene/squalene synthase family protein [Candidatus Bathyarchaeota archaeon]